MMVTDYIDGEAQLSQDEFDSGDEFIKDADSQDNLFIDNSDVVMEDDSSHMEVDMNQIAVESEQTMQQALAVQSRLETALQTRQAQPVNTSRSPVVNTCIPKKSKVKEVTESYKPIGPQIVFMPEKASINIAGAVKPVLTLALPVWLGAYTNGSLAEVEMAQAIQYVLNAATIVQQKDGARIYVTLWCMGRCASVRGMSYKEALLCSANPGKYVAEIFCQDIDAVKKFSDCLNDINVHLKMGAFITKLKKKIEMHVPRDRFNIIEPRMLSDGMQLSRALVSVAQKIGTANASNGTIPQCRSRVFVCNCYQNTNTSSVRDACGFSI